MTRQDSIVRTTNCPSPLWSPVHSVGMELEHCMDCIHFLSRYKLQPDLSSADSAMGIGGCLGGLAKRRGTEQEEAALSTHRRHQCLIMREVLEETSAAMWLLLRPLSCVELVPRSPILSSGCGRRAIPASATVDTLANLDGGGNS